MPKRKKKLLSGDDKDEFPEHENEPGLLNMKKQRSYLPLI